jgi:hypothetical protein
MNAAFTPRVSRGSTQRLGERLPYARVLRNMPSMVISAERTKDGLELGIGLPPDGKPPDIRGPHDVLRLIAGPLLEGLGDRVVGKGPLASALKKEVKDRGISEHFQSQVFNQVACGYVFDYSPTWPNAPALPALDEMPGADVKTWFEQPRPRGAIRVKLSDPHWADHLERFRAYPVPMNALREEAEPWTESPRRWS